MPFSVGQSSGSPSQADQEPIRQSITVNEKITAAAPANLTVLQTEDLRAMPGIHLDDRLRLVPGFSLFRRSSSLTANPTTQGVSLRGIGSTGASRTLLLWDGVPLNDPFGGWVYWNRVDPEELQRMEVSRAGYTSVFGDRAMGGTVGLFTLEPATRYRAAWDFGGRGQQQLSGGLTHLWRKFALSASARAFTWDGYYLVPEANRGRVDTEANSRFVAGTVRGDYLGSRTGCLFDWTDCARNATTGRSYSRTLRHWAWSPAPIGANLDWGPCP